MAIDIFLKEIASQRKFQFPSLPTDLTIAHENNYSTYSLLDYGEITIPNGKVPSEVSWKGTFYGESRKNMSFLIRKWVSPTTAYNTLLKWKNNGTPLRLVVADTPINVDVTISSFEATPTGGFGDYEYSIKLVEYEDKTVKVIKKPTSNTSSKKTTTTKRATTQSNTYTVKDGDTLWDISLKYYKTGTKWKTIYNKNKSVIEAAAKKHGKKSSDNGHWIYAGTKLIIP